nr:phosphatidate cytidylyltransferase, photoreceptor-specific-like [Onthophagus taurus]
MGIVMMLIMTLMIQIKGFFELIDIAYQMCKMHDLPWFRSLSWYFLIAANYYFYGENIMEHFYVFIEDIPSKHGKKQFALLAWTHVALLVIVTSSYTAMRNCFHGLIWCVHGLVIMAFNDIFAYICGKLLGKTPLIKVSPKKTWEGFIGGAVFSIFLSFLIASFLCQYDYLVCPIEYRKIKETITLINTCERSYMFKLKDYSFELEFLNISLKTTIRVYPFVLHAFWFALFGSIIAPFGGFFASGFKRAFNVKDFGCAIPGHGGILDRFDCQIFMTNFINVYIATFVKTSTVEALFKKILKLKSDDQLEFFWILQEQLLKHGA